MVKYLAKEAMELFIRQIFWVNNMPKKFKNLI